MYRRAYTHMLTNLNHSSLPHFHCSLPSLLINASSKFQSSTLLPFQKDNQPNKLQTFPQINNLLYRRFQYTKKNSIWLFYKWQNVFFPPSKHCLHSNNKTSSHLPLPGNNYSSSLNAIFNLHSSHPLVARIHTLSIALTSLKIITTFIWYPGHIGITGNESVETAAKAATRLPKIQPRLLPIKSDLTDIPVDETLT